MSDPDTRTPLGLLLKSVLSFYLGYPRLVRAGGLGLIIGSLLLPLIGGPLLIGTGHPLIGTVLLMACAPWALLLGRLMIKGRRRRGRAELCMARSDQKIGAPLVPMPWWLCLLIVWDQDPEGVVMRDHERRRRRTRGRGNPDRE